MLTAPCDSREAVKRPASVSHARRVGGLLPETLFFETVTDFSVVNAEEFGHSGGHVDIVRLSLGTFLVEELIHRVVLGVQLEQNTHDDKKRLAKVRGAPLAAGLAV